MIVKEIQSQFNKVISHSQGIFNPQTDNLFKKWAEAKSWFLTRFDGPIYEVPTPIAFRLGDKERRSRFDHFITTVTTVYNNIPLSDFLMRNVDGFYENKTVFDSLAADGETVIKAGTKLIKAFKYFEENEQCLAHLQTAASMILQEDKVEGKLCFSVHPLDYLSASENNYNWRSCHALDGEYRCGNLSYMCDKTTIVCYLKGEKDEILPRFPDDVPWNSKKWRMLLTYDPKEKMLFAGRQYPFFSEGALEKITPFLFRALKIDGLFWSGWHDDFISNWHYKTGNADDGGTYKYLPIGERLYNINELIKNETSNGTVLHFNDLLSSSCYSPYYCWNKYVWRSPTEKVEITVGSNPPCVCCGKQDIAFTDMMFCEACGVEYADDDNDQVATCDCCGRRFLANEGQYTEDDAFICERCQDNECYRCRCCGRLVFKDRAVYDKKLDGFLCVDCWNDKEKEE